MWQGPEEEEGMHHHYFCSATETEDDYHQQINMASLIHRKETVCPLHYHYNQKGCTAALESEAYLSWPNNRFINEDWQILFSADNVPDHSFIELCSIKFEVLPSDTTNRLQALAVGIIAQGKGPV